MDNGLVLSVGKNGTVNHSAVLILVVVDNGLVQGNHYINSVCNYVLILVVVDNGLVHSIDYIVDAILIRVLILVVVDNGLVRPHRPPS